jgi:hypothetical protein
LTTGWAEVASHGGWPQPAAPLLTTRHAAAFGELAFVSMFTTFGAPQGMTLAALRVERLFAADGRDGPALVGRECPQRLQVRPTQTAHGSTQLGSHSEVEGF